VRRLGAKEQRSLRLELAIAELVAEATPPDLARAGPPDAT